MHVKKTIAERQAIKLRKRTLRRRDKVSARRKAHEHFVATKLGTNPAQDEQEKRKVEDKHFLFMKEFWRVEKFGLHPDYVNSKATRKQPLTPKEYKHQVKEWSDKLTADRLEARKKTEDKVGAALEKVGV